MSSGTLKAVCIVKQGVVPARLVVALMLLAAWPLAAGPVNCIPLPLPDGSFVPGWCEDDSWLPQPPWWYLPPWPPEPTPPPPWLLLPPLPEPDPPPPFWFFETDPVPNVILPDPGASPSPAPFEDGLRIAPDDDPRHAPEPGGLALIGLGLLVLGILGRWRSMRRPR